MVKQKLRRWDPAEGLNSEEDWVGYLQAGLEENHTATVLGILGDIARSKGMEREVVEAGLHPEYLIVGSQFQEEPDLSTLLAIIRVLGLRLHAGTASSPTLSPDFGVAFRPEFWYP